MAERAQRLGTDSPEPIFERRLAKRRHYLLVMSHLTQRLGGIGTVRHGRRVPQLVDPLFRGLIELQGLQYLVRLVK